MAHPFPFVGLRSTRGRVPGICPQRGLPRARGFASRHGVPMVRHYLPIARRNLPRLQAAPPISLRQPLPASRSSGPRWPIRFQAQQNLIWRPGGRLSGMWRHPVAQPQSSAPHQSVRTELTSLFVRLSGDIAPGKHSMINKIGHSWRS
jgi:hypothetical protein